MKKIIPAVFAIFLFSAITVQAEVYDLDALTGDYGATNPSDTENGNINSNTNTAVTNTNAEVSDEAVTFAECLIYKKLEIDDAKCDRMLASLSCPAYVEYLEACEEQHHICLQNIGNKSTNATYSRCVGAYNSCTDFAVDQNNECGKQFPPRTAAGEITTQFNLSGASGDVRVFYDDNPTPNSMEAVEGSRTIQTGAAIFTGDTGTVVLNLPNGVTQYIGPNSYFRIADYFTGDTLSSTYTILENGNVVVGIEHPEDNTNVAYTVITPLWNVSAKGTEFEVTVADDGTETIEVTSGVVEIVDHLGVESEVVSAGETVTSDAYGLIREDPVVFDAMPIIAEDTTPISRPLDPWYTNIWGWVGVLAILAVLGVVGLSVIIFLIVIITRRKRS